MAEEQDLIPNVALETVTAEILILKKQTAQNIIDIGRRLIQAKEIVGHGNWLAYLSDRVQFSDRTAQRFMRAATVLANATPVSDLDPTKALLLLETPEDERESLALQATDMTKRELEAKVRELNAAKRENAELARQLEKAVQDAETVKNQPPKTITRTVTAPDPRQGQIIEELRRDLDAARKQYAELLAAARGTAEANRELEQAKSKVAVMENRLRRIGVQFDDEGRDQYGGSKLMDALEPLFLPLAQAVAGALVVKRLGAGGVCDDDKLKATVPQLRQLADILDEILKDRASRPINVTPLEVE